MKGVKYERKIAISYKHKVLSVRATYLVQFALSKLVDFFCFSKILGVSVIDELGPLIWKGLNKLRFCAIVGSAGCF
jgi:hypothetical protein